MAFLFLRNTEQKKAVKSITNHFKVPASCAFIDYTNTCDILSELIKPEGACPLHDLNLNITAPFSTEPSAPYRMDLAITYRCNNDC
jgi:hypothetical protein